MRPIPDRIDLVRAVCRALSLDDGGRLAPDLSRLSDGGWISRDGAVRLALELAKAAGMDLALEARRISGAGVAEGARG